MFTDGAESRFVNYYTSSRHFRLAQNVEEYRATLQHEIESNLTVCDRQLFIFDEARRFPSNLLDSLAPFFDPGSPESKKAAKSVFMFIYEGDEPVVEWALELHENGIHRNDITMRDAELKIIPYINSDQSLQGSLLVKKGLIQHHLPFLPLEQAHVRMCIQDAVMDLFNGIQHDTQPGLLESAFCNTMGFGLKHAGSFLTKYTPGLEARHYVKCLMSTGAKLSKEELERITDQVQDEVVFYHQNTFSVFGCKKIGPKVRALLNV